MKNLLVFLVIILIQSAAAQNIRSLELFSVSSIIRNSELQFDEDFAGEINEAFEGSLSKSGSTSLNIGGENTGNNYSLFEILQIMDSRADSNNLGVYIITAGWKTGPNSEYQMMNSENHTINFTYISNFLRINPARNQLLILLMPKGSEIPPSAIDGTASRMMPGVNILLLPQRANEPFSSHIEDFISAIKDIDNKPDSDTDKDKMINMSEYLNQLENKLAKEGIYFENLNVAKGPEIILMEVK